MSYITIMPVAGEVINQIPFLAKLASTARYLFTISTYCLRTVNKFSLVVNLLLNESTGRKSLVGSSYWEEVFSLHPIRLTLNICSSEATPQVLAGSALTSPCFGLCRTSLIYPSPSAACVSKLSTHTTSCLRLSIFNVDHHTQSLDHQDSICLQSTAAVEQVSRNVKKTSCHSIDQVISGTGRHFRIYERLLALLASDIA